MRLDLYYRTRSRAFLWQTSGLLLIVFLAVCGVLNHYPHAAPVDPVDDLFTALEDAEDEADEAESPAERLARARPAVQRLLASEASFNDQLEEFVWLYGEDAWSPAEIAPSRPEVPALSAGDYAVFLALTTALHEAKQAGEGTAEPTAAARLACGASLAEAAERQPAAPGAHFAWALFLAQIDATEPAIAAAQEELAVADSAIVRYWIVETCYDAEHYALLHGFEADPAFAPFLGPGLLHDMAIAERNWPVVLQTLIPAAYEDTPRSIFALALLTGLVWAVLLLRFGDARCSLWPWGLAALVLGALSAHATVLVILLQESYLSFFEGQEMWQQIGYCVAGIGLREEVVKLAFFLPLLPFLRRREDDLSLLIVASLVGLGFAMEENVGYFQDSGGASALGRLVTANFLHISLTGLAGWATARAVFDRGEDIAHAFNVLGLAIIAHGAYDAFYEVEALADYDLVSIIIFVLVARQYFACLTHYRPQWRDPLSVTALFTWGVCLVFGGSLLVMTWDQGLREALGAIAGEIPSIGVILFMFYREIPESVV